MRMFSVADQRSIPEIERRHADRGRLPRAAADRRRAGAGGRAGRRSTPPGEGAITGSVTDMLAKLAEGIPVDGMEALLPVLRPGRSRAADRSAGRGHAGAAVRPGEGPHPGRRPDQDRPRIPGGVLVGRRHGHLGDSAPVDVEQLGGSGFAELDDVRAAARPVRPSVVDAEPAVRRVGRRAGHPGGAVGARASARYRRHLRDAARPRLRPAGTP